MRRTRVAAVAAVALTVGVLGPAQGSVPPSYTITDLGVLGSNYSVAYGINETPVVVGNSSIAPSGNEAFRWQAGTMTSLGSFNASHDSIARSVNESGQVVGGSADGAGGSHAFRWESGTMSDLGILAPPFNYSEAFGINDTGQVVGDSLVPPVGFTHAVLWDGTGIHDLGTLAGGDSSHARAINTGGLVAGDSEITSGGNTHAVEWNNTGPPIDIGTLPGDGSSNATAVNDAGHVAGRSISSAGAQKGFFWNGSSMTQIPNFSGGTFVEVQGMNSGDAVVGRADRLDGSQTAFLWEAASGQITDLNTLLPSGSGWQLAIANAINDAGQIAGYGYHNNELHAFLLTPSAQPAPSDVAIGAVAPGGSVSTDAGAPGATPADPIATTVQSPNAAVIGIHEGVSDVPLSTDFQILGQQTRITVNPQGTVDAPIRVTFDFDASLLPAGADETTVQILRDDTVALPCLIATRADPDPCVVTRTRLGDGDVEISVLTSHASAWTGAVRRWPFTGFFAPVDNPPTYNVANAGSAIPVKFRLGGNRGLGIFASGSPSSRSIPCNASAPLDQIEQTSPATADALSYDSRTDTYTYVWKTPKSFTACRELIVALADGSTHTARFRFK